MHGPSGTALWWWQVGRQLLSPESEPEPQHQTLPHAAAPSSLAAIAPVSAPASAFAFVSSPRPQHPEPALRLVLLQAASPPQLPPSPLLEPIPIPAVPGTDSDVEETVFSSEQELDSPQALLPAKRVRDGRPKVKTGCLPCRQHRVKCDEARPACLRCSLAARSCTGYPPLLRTRRWSLQPTPIAPKPKSKPRPFIAAPPTGLCLYRPSAAPPLLRPDQASYFQLFQFTVAPELSGFFDSSFWRRSVLQECHAEPAIHHATIALGALYKALEPRLRPDSEPDPGSKRKRKRAGDLGNGLLDAKAHWQVAFNHYSHACNALLRFSPSSIDHARTHLMASVLMTCFDSFVGDHMQAILQIQNGLRLLSRLRSAAVSSISCGPTVDDELASMVSRLALQAKSYHLAFHFPAPYIVRFSDPMITPPPPVPVLSMSESGLLSPPLTSPSISSPSDSLPSLPSSPSICPSPTSFTTVAASVPIYIPDAFASLADARRAWDQLLQLMYRFTETLADVAQMNDSPALPLLPLLPPRLRESGAVFGGQIEAWIRAFEPLLAARADMTPVDQAATAVLKMSQIVGRILFLMTFSSSEMLFDRFQPDFATIVRLAREVLKSPMASQPCPQQTAQSRRPLLCADMGIIPPLYVVATKCRFPRLRRSAFALLRASARREAMWDSELIARISSWIAMVEEDGNRTSIVPEHRRVTVHSVHFDLCARHAHVTVGSRGAAAIGGAGGVDGRWRETYIKW